MRVDEINGLSVGHAIEPSSLDSPKDGTRI